MRFKYWLILVPVLCAATVFVLTRHSKKQYISTTTLYTGVASGYSITSTEDERLDYFAVNNAFDNLVSSAKSRETIEQISLRLLAEHLALLKPDPMILSQPGFDALQQLAGIDLIVKARQLGDKQKIYDYISKLYASKTNNIIDIILNKPGFYSIKDLQSNLVITRVATSDMLQVTYTCSDPAVCQHTLELHTQIFTANYHRIKSDQTYSAVQYFENKLAEVKKDLEKSEDDLKNFGQQNRIINYYEQTRYIAQSKEDVDKNIYAERVKQKASKNTLGLVEAKLNSRNKQMANTANLVSLRERLSDVNANYDKAKLYNNTAKAEAYRKQAIALEDSIRSESNQYMNLNYTLETVPRNELIQQWVDNAVQTDKATSGLNVLDKQKQYYLGEIDQLAPLGSTLKRLERQVDVNQQEYLSILHGLNLAKLRQSNLSLSANIVVQDKPFFPLDPQPSTRMLLVVLSFFVGFIAVASVVLGRELMDSSIKSPERAKKIIGLPLAGISVTYPGSGGSEYQLALKNSLTEQLLSNLLPYIALKIANGQQAQINLLTTKTGVYKLDSLQLFSDMLASVYPNLCWIVPNIYTEVFNALNTRQPVKYYIPTVAHLNAKDAGNLVNEDLSGYDLILYLSPNLSHNSLPAMVANNGSVSVLVFSSKDTWLTVDKDLLRKVRNVTEGIPVNTWLVSAEERDLEDTIGEIEKKRSWLRRKIKKMIALKLV